MLHTKSQGHQPSGSGEEDFKRVFTIYGHVGHLGQVTETMKIEFNGGLPQYRVIGPIASIISLVRKAALLLSSSGFVIIVRINKLINKQKTHAFLSIQRLMK